MIIRLIGWCTFAVLFIRSLVFFSIFYFPFSSIFFYITIIQYSKRCLALPHPRKQTMKIPWKRFWQLVCTESFGQIFFLSNRKSFSFSCLQSANWSSNQVCFAEHHVVVDLSAAAGTAACPITYTHTSLRYVTVWEQSLISL